MTTDTTTDTGRLTINGLLVDGKYRTRESYTEAQMEEILDIAEKSGKAALRYVRPDLVDNVVVDKLRVDGDAGNVARSRLETAPLAGHVDGLTDATVLIVGGTAIAMPCVTAIVITLLIKLL